ncbi:MAG: MerR family transcriptional regulator [Deltaproteobacteria bacterium]|nr:MerR family transcriptional regulator [Deltaproteobacteria bacterium]
MAQINVFDKIGLNIDQVSQMTGVKKTTLRYWEKEFSDYLKPERTDSRRRQYSLVEVEKVAVLKQLIEEEKYKSAGVRLKLGLGLMNSASNTSETSAMNQPPGVLAGLPDG